MNKNTLTFLSALGIAILIGVTAYAALPSADITYDGPSVTIYKSPNCGCCVKHSAYLKKNGFKVDIEMVDDMEAIKRKFGIPNDMQSCHTTVMGDYFIEGHVPIEAFNKLMEEKPDIDGIALPEMPSGSPGMPGPKLEPFEIFEIKDGKAQTFITL